jgi:hypothetical protein
MNAEAKHAARIVPAQVCNLPIVRFTVIIGKLGSSCDWIPPINFAFASLVSVLPAGLE